MKTIKMINRFGNEFDCPESEVQRYLDFGATIVEEKPKVEKK